MLVDEIHRKYKKGIERGESFDSSVCQEEQKLYAEVKNGVASVITSYCNLFQPAEETVDVAAVVDKKDFSTNNTYYRTH